MKKLFVLLLLSCSAVVLSAGCSKKKEGVCYCKYVSGDKKEFDLTSLNRSQAKDSCSVLSGYADAFGGSCKLK